MRRKAFPGGEAGWSPPPREGAGHPGPEAVPGVPGADGGTLEDTVPLAAPASAAVATAGVVKVP